ncbi:MAG: oligosaccharide flippase family protein [Kofleriaceae bacterium]|nr:oligosaccharide flippase family protein [Kofleriaceae bacterium]
MKDTRLGRDVAWNLVPVALLAVVGLGLKIFITKWWGPAALGSFNLVTFVMMSIAILGAGGLQYAVLRAVAEAPDDRERVASVVVGALMPNVVLAALATVLFVALRHPVGALLKSTAVAEGILWAAPALFCFSLNKVLLGVVNGLRRMRAFAVYTSLRYLLIATGLVVCRMLEAPAAQLPMIWTIAEGALLVVLIGELLATVAVTRAKGWVRHAKQQLDFGLRGVTSTLAYEVNSKLDLWMLQMLLHDERLAGIYAMASALFEGAMQLPIVLQNNVNPLIARHLAERQPEQVEALARRTRRWFVPALVVACGIGALVYPAIIPWLAGSEEIAEGAVPFAILMGGIALASPWLPFNQLLLMGGRPGWHTVYVVIVMLVTALVSWQLIPVLGLAGAAIANAAGIVISASLLVVLGRTKLHVSI